MSRVLVLSLVFPPDGVSTAQLLGDIAHGLKGHGHEVSVLSTMPHYNRDETAERAQPIKPRWFGGESDYFGIRVYHIRMPHKSRSGLIRVIQWLWFHLASTLVAWSQRRPDVILATSPPLTIGGNAWAAGRFGRVPFILNVWEIYPDIAVTLGYLHNRAAISMLKRLESATYARATAITVTSERARRTIVESGRADGSKVRVVPNFSDLDGWSRPPGDFGSRHRLDGRFVVTYAGNMGPAQHLDDLLDASTMMPDADILLVGGGSEQQSLALRSSELANCTVLPHQPSSAVPDIYGATSLGVVPLASGVTNEMPAKAVQLMAAGVPILAIAENESALSDLIAAAGCGVVIPPGRPDLIAKTCTDLKADSIGLAEMASNGRRYAEEHFAREAVIEAYIELAEAAAR